MNQLKNQSTIRFVWTRQVSKCSLGIKTSFHFYFNSLFKLIRELYWDRPTLEDKYNLIFEIH